jgi:hypothetical protein
MLTLDNRSFSAPETASGFYDRVLPSYAYELAFMKDWGVDKRAVALSDLLGGLTL